MLRPPRIAVLALSLVISLAYAGRVQAQTSVAAAREGLSSQDASQIGLAIETLALSGSRDAVEPIAARIRAGLPPALLDTAIDALTVLARPEAGPILYELLTHRRPSVRVKAVQAILAARPSGAENALIAALQDLDPATRGAAALGLGQLRSRRATDALFLAFERNVPEAATALAQVVAANQVSRLLDFLGRASFDTMKPAISELLARSDVPERTKLDVLSRLGDLATGDVKAYLLEYIATIPPNDRSAVRRTAQEIANRIAN